MPDQRYQPLAVNHDGGHQALYRHFGQSPVTGFRQTVKPLHFGEFALDSRSDTSGCGGTVPPPFSGNDPVFDADGSQDRPILFGAEQVHLEELLGDQAGRPVDDSYRS